ncbi:hypothetical protein JHK82_051456 [Glycine max]|nr:hypothetical protein JHK82_051456 [Glycine max]
MLMNRCRKSSQCFSTSSLSTSGDDPKVALSRASSTVTNHCLCHLRNTCNVVAEKLTLTRLKQKHCKREPISAVSTHD